MKKMRKIIIKDDLSTNPPKSGKRSWRPPLSSARILPNGMFGSELREGKRP
jgi:hypothetical protein